MKRIIAGVAVAAVFILLVYVQGIYLKVAAVFVSLISEYEILHAIKQSGIKTIDLPLYLFCILLLPALLFWGLEGMLFLYALCLMALFIIAIVSGRYDYKSCSASALTMLYPQLLFVFLYEILLIEEQRTALFLLTVGVASAAGSDTFAYFTGKLCGKKKLCPHISPHKTVEGAFGGLFGGVLCTMAVVWILGETTCPFYIYIIAAAVFSLLSQFGDLAASLTKRYYGVKDYGTILGEHGGILDRMCSILFVMPAVLAFFRIFYC